MAWEKLPTDHTNAVWNGLKKYQKISNDDGTLSLNDVTKYEQKEGSFFSAEEANKMNGALNDLMDMVNGGTNLYDDFTAYFENGKKSFTASADAATKEITDYETESKSKCDTAVSGVETYATESKSKCDTAVSGVETYATESEGKCDTSVSEVATYATESKSKCDTSVSEVSTYAADSKAKCDTSVKEVSDYAASTKASIDSEHTTFTNHITETTNAVDTEHQTVSDHMTSASTQIDTDLNSIKTKYEQEASQFQASAEDDFNTWFDAIKEQVSEAQLSADDAMSDTSEHAVQNKVIKSYTDNAIATADSNAQGYANTALTSAKSYSDDQLASSKQYTDEQISAIPKLTKESGTIGTSDWVGESAPFTFSFGDDYKSKLCIVAFQTEAMTADEQNSLTQCALSTPAMDGDSDVDSPTIVALKAKPAIDIPYTIYSLKY